MTQTDTLSGRSASRLRATAVAVALATVAMAAALAAPAQAEFGIAAFDGEVTANQAGDAYTQAGGHPYDASTTVRFVTHTDDIGQSAVDEDVKTVEVTLPPGLVGNPQGIPQCQPADFFTVVGGGFGPTACPHTSQVGIVRIPSAGFSPDEYPALYNLRPASDDIPAAFGFGLAGQRILLEATVGPAPDYAVKIAARNVSQGTTIIGSEVTIWGTPSSPSHDIWRCQNPVDHPTWGLGCTVPGSDLTQPHSVVGLVDERPLISLPTSCTAPGVGVETSVRAESWVNQGVFDSASFMSHLPPGYPLPPEQWGAQQGPEGCEDLAFEPSVTVQPDEVRADSPTGLDVRMSFSQRSGLDDPEIPTAAHLKRASVTLPEGMSINPAAADGLAACTDEQLGRFDTEPPRCPEASKVGTASAVTPILEDPLSDGSVYVGSQNSSDPASGEMFRLFLVIRGPGMNVKLVGEVEADPQTGRLTASFDNNPQYPVSSIDVRIKGGPRAPLATPATCGPKKIGIELTSWAGHVVETSDSFTVPCPANQAFAPAFDAGSELPLAGSFSPFVALIDRPQGQQFLSGVSVDMPKGLVAKLAGVELCPDGLADDGTPGRCPAGSRIGSATVGAGSGSQLHLPGDVYLTGPYKGAPYGLSVQVPVKAGPFDMGVVKVRQRIDVDPETAEISVGSDPLPQIVSGVPARLRSVNVDVDRPGFMINPTSCSEQQLSGVLASIDGQTRTIGRRFQAGACQALAFKPKMTMRLSGKRQTRTGGHPSFATTLRQGKGQANIGAVKVTLPSSIALDANNSYDPALVCDYDKAQQADCPASSIIGKATAHTPVLGKPLTGPVHLVQGIKFGPKGNRIRTTPALLVKLRGEVAINLRGQTTTERRTNRLVTTFAKVPDAPVSRFDLRVNGGRKGILVVTRTRRGKIDLCDGAQVASVETDGHNGRRADYRATVKTPCGAKAAKAKRAKKAKRDR